MHARQSRFGGLRARPLRATGIALAALLLGSGCKRQVVSDEAGVPYVVSEQKSDIEEQNLRAMCQAAAQVLEEGAPDRTTRMAELALAGSADTSLVDGLRATEPPKRMGVMRALIKKYGLAVECQPSLPAFEKGPPRPEELSAEQATPAEQPPQPVGIPNEPVVPEVAPRPPSVSPP